MAEVDLDQIGYLATLADDHDPDLHYPQPMPAQDDSLRKFANLIRETRESLGWSQMELASASGVSRPTINRYEQGKTGTPDPETVRALFLALQLDPRRIPVILGYVTAEEMGIDPDPPRVFDKAVEEALEILQDPSVDAKEKAEWIEFLRFRARRDPGTPKGRRTTG